MKNLNELQERLEELQTELESFEINQDEYEDQYCDMLDEVSTVQIGSLSYDPSTVLREVDPIAYRCGLNDYVDSLDVEDDEKYKELQEQIEEIESQISDLEEEE